uniref:Uncharacterized protein n=1 Tax=Arundo donax TaxID=35708 RepID=A0A0A8XNM2_ARUDO
MDVLTTKDFMYPKISSALYKINLCQIKFSAEVYFSMPLI